MMTYPSVRHRHDRGLYRPVLQTAAEQGAISLSLWLGSRLLREYIRRRREEKARGAELQRSEVVAAWFAANGDKTMRLDYALNAESIVLDLGGYEGSWTSDIYAMYQSRVYIFEPVDRFHQFICHRFRHNQKITAYKFGLAEADRNDVVHLNADSSSKFKKPQNELASAAEHVQLVEISGFLERERLKHIDLMKINIEGGEYDLLEHVLETGLQARIKNIQIQFHTFIPNAVERMNRIKDQLRKTHYSTYEYEFVWENWVLRDTVALDNGA